MSSFLEGLADSVSSLYLYDDHEYDEEGFNIVWPLTIFFGFGIWLVVRRYQDARDRGVPFTIPAPEVSCSWTFLLINFSML